MNRAVPAGVFLDGPSCVLLARLVVPLVRSMGPAELEQLRPAFAAIGRAADVQRSEDVSRLTPVPSGWLSTGEAAVVLGCTPRAVVKAIATGRLPAQRQGRCWRVDGSALAG
jgi:excisionase family DNA binding protein